jgi:hypothetical protein
VIQYDGIRLQDKNKPVHTERHEDSSHNYKRGHQNILPAAGMDIFCAGDLTTILITTQV